ncbi:virulence RhuM family protein [Rhodopseudomonas palustris]|uniref:virulence RhuM family protein n=1 Tax=Rhodopseudomonas palustris TaxID=1076 RepID=UPI002ACECF4E|nr:virulence RhuM family protein [Rhodopseudomonas palustris]WQH01780.1 virulence RhuM family protein [Rhodopseudomonas palustris]
MTLEDSKGEGELILYRTEDGRDAVQLRLVDGTVWLTQAEIALLFETTPQNITQHLRAIFEQGELTPEATCKQSLQVRLEGERRVRRSTNLYNLNVILAVGYRVRSARGVQFRRWATEVLNDYLVKGFVMNDERLKDPAGFDYFDELLERIRDIRASEKRFYQKVRDLFAATSADYDPKAETAKTFFASIQNKLVFAITGKTAAELIVARADPARPNMALTSWKGDRVRKGDVTISKNYLTADEISDLNLLTTAFLDFAELRARNRQPTTMAEWMAQTDRFVAFNERGVLQGAGRVSHASMEQVVAERFETFDKRRRAAETDAAEAEAISELTELEQQARLSKPGPAGNKPQKKLS